MTMPIARSAFVTFLLNAKRQTYAAQGDDASVTPLLPGSRQLDYRDGMLFYRDIYFGGAYFVGQETIYYDSSPVWSMCYAGGVTKDIVAQNKVGEVYEFLRAALQQVTPERPYRGPSMFSRNAYVYADESQGDMEHFFGIETIVCEGQPVYELHYGGGLLR